MVHLNQFITALDSLSDNTYPYINGIISRKNENYNCRVSIWIDDDYSQLINPKRILSYDKKIIQSENTYYYLFKDNNELDFQLVIKDHNVIGYDYLCFINGEWKLLPVYQYGNLTNLNFKFL